MKQSDLKEQLIKRRGWGLRLPKAENVVLLLTGGLDSSLLAEMCIKLLEGVHIYPIYIQRGGTAQRFEEKAAKDVVTYLQKKYSKDAIADLFFIEVCIPPLSLREALTETHVAQHGWPMRNTILELYAVQYASILSHQQTSIYTIMTGSIGDDIHPDSQPISYLATTFAVCTNLDNWNWQIVAPFLLPEFIPGKASLFKQDIVAWGIRNQFPFHLTYSCPRGTDGPCGTCKDCKIRKTLIP